MEYRNVSIPLQETKSTKLPSKMFSNLKKVSFETLIEVMKPVVMGDRRG